jgi:hypothetical protein
MKALLHFATALGARTVVAEIGDVDTAQAVVNAHMASGGRASLVEEMPRVSLKDHMTKHKRAMAKTKVKVVSVTPSNVTSLAKRRAKG